MKIALLFLLLFCTSAFGQNKPSDSLSANQNVFPGDIGCIPQPFYRHRPDGKPGREVTLQFKEAKLFGKAQVEVKTNGKTEITQLPPVVGGRTEGRVLLPPEIGVKQASQVTLTLRQGTRTLTKTVLVPALRHWTVYLYSHSHVDIGYTNTQANVEILHKRNIDEGIKLGEETKDYPAGARSRWNPEVTWPLERYWTTATPAQKEQVVKAIKNGYLCMDASYLNLNTSSCSDEEMFQIFRFSRGMQKLTGVPINTFQQMDIPGMSWGLVPVMAQQGVRYIMSWPNSCRAGYGRTLDEKPFWWIGPDGKSKILFFQPGGYANGGSMTKGGATGSSVVWTARSRQGSGRHQNRQCKCEFHWMPCPKRERPDNPYNFHVISWSLWDNCPLDADIPLAVKDWNAAYAYPHIVIAGGTEIMQMIEKELRRPASGSKRRFYRILDRRFGYRRTSDRYQPERQRAARTGRNPLDHASSRQARTA